jgi:hypothetical protein
LKKEIEEDTGRWKVCLCSWTGRINIMKTVYGFNAIPKIQKFNVIICRMMRNSHGSIKA